MKKSIRYKYTFIFALVITLILLSIWCVNNLFLEDYYISNKARTLKESYEQIDEMLRNNPSLKLETFNETEDETVPETPEMAFLRELGEKYNISIFIIDKKTGGYLTTEPPNGRVMAMQVKESYRTNYEEKNEPKERERDYAPGPPFDETEVLSTTEYYTIQKFYNRRFDSSYLQSRGYFSNPDIAFLMSLPLSSIKESVALSNRFFSIISLAGLLLGSIVVFLTTKRIAAPILQLSKLSGQMSNLNFDVRYTGEVDDEIGILGSSMNVLSGKLKETMEELQSANSKLQSDIEQKIKIDEMRKDFVANVSHELKTPITIIHGYAEGLADGMCKDEESRSFYYQVILNESDKMTVLVRQLLNLSNMECGFDQPDMGDFDLTSLISDILASQEVLLKENNVNLEFDVTQPVYVWADEFKIEEVFNNYLSNALNHLEGERRIKIEITQQEKTVKTTVFNTGKQIPEEDIENLWSKFYKVDKARTRQYGGSGIGLSIVKAIMDSHKRECGVKNKEDGVEFWFELEGQECHRSQPG